MQCPDCTGISFSYVSEASRGRQGDGRGETWSVFYTELFVWECCVKAAVHGGDRKDGACEMHVCLACEGSYGFQREEGAVEGRVGGVEYHYPSPSLSLLDVFYVCAFGVGTIVCVCVYAC